MKNKNVLVFKNETQWFNSRSRFHSSKNILRAIEFYSRKKGIISRTDSVSDFEILGSLFHTQLQQHTIANEYKDTILKILSGYDSDTRLDIMKDVGLLVNKRTNRIYEVQLNYDVLDYRESYPVVYLKTPSDMNLVVSDSRVIFIEHRAIKVHTKPQRAARILKIRNSRVYNQKKIGMFSICTSSTKSNYQ